MKKIVYVLISFILIGCSTTQKSKSCCEKESINKEIKK